MYFFLFLSASSILVKKKARGSHCPLLPPSVVSEKFVFELVLIAAVCPISTNESCFKLKRAELYKWKVFLRVSVLGTALMGVYPGISEGLLCFHVLCIYPAVLNSHSWGMIFTLSALVYQLVFFRAQFENHCLCESYLLFSVSQCTSQISPLCSHVPCVCTKHITYQTLGTMTPLLIQTVWGA